MRIRTSARLLTGAASLAALALAATTLSPTASATPAADAAGTCQNLAFTVATAPNGAAAQTISGTLCTPNVAPHATQLDILVHGASYNRSYWDWPVQPSSYSYVAETLKSGRATFAYDRLGAGQSSHPLSALVTTSADAYILHELIGKMRASGYTRIDVIGHSFGSVVAIDEDAAYSDVDKLVVTGLLHSQGPGLATVATTFYPATLDPEYYLTTLDAGYLTTLPGTRRNSFYSPTADPTVIAYDEAHKDVISGTELAAGVVESQLPPLTNASRLVTAPVLILDGQQDQIFCGLYVNCASPASVRAVEAGYYPSAARLAVITVPTTGHDAALHPTAGTSFTSIDQWIKSG
jgi:pimeloyl-ACP methyl ester carboxylesterase